LALFTEDGRPNVAGFEISEDLGRSAANVRLYRARQHVINRDVLLEVVVAREDASQHAWASLRGEAGALGKLSHPNIVQVHDVGERDRQLFYNATEMVDGPTLAQKVADKPLPFPQVIRLMEVLARAVDHAHKKGVLHRNLRPACVLLQPIDVPRNSPARDYPSGPACLLHSGFFIPKLTGFGLARRPVEGDAIDAELFGDDTGYLSPEQAWGRGKDLGPHTDVYGLGGILYFLLAGRPPFRGPSLSDILDAIQTAPLVPPSSMRRVPADLEAICRKCLARQPRRRYASAGELADDLTRAAHNLPVRARPASAVARMGRAIRRRPAIAALLVLSLVGFIATLVAYSQGAGEVEKEKVLRQRAETTRKGAEAELAQRAGERRAAERFKELVNYRQVLDSVAGEIALGKPDRARNLLEGCQENVRGFEWHYWMARTQGPPDKTDRPGRKVLERVANNDFTAMAFSPVGKHVATAESGAPLFPGGPKRGVVSLWRVRTPIQKLRSLEVSGPVHALAFSPNGLRLAVASENPTTSTAEVRALSLDEGPQFGNQLWSHAFPGKRYTGIAFSGDQIVLARDNGQLDAVYSSNGQLARQDFGRPLWLFREGSSRLAVGPDGTIGVSTNGGEPQLFSSSRNNPVGGPMMPQAGGTVQALALGANHLLAVARSDGSIHIEHHNVSATPDRLAGLPGVQALAFSADGKRLAAACNDGSVRLWGLADTAPVELLRQKLPDDAGKVVGLAFSASGKALAVGWQRKVVVWGVVEE
jgi:hypothetical protein